MLSKVRKECLREICGLVEILMEIVEVIDELDLKYLRKVLREVRRVKEEI